LKVVALAMIIIQTYAINAKTNMFYTMASVTNLTNFLQIACELTNMTIPFATIVQYVILGMLWTQQKVVAKSVRLALALHAQLVL